MILAMKLQKETGPALGDSWMLGIEARMFFPSLNKHGVYLFHAISSLVKVVEAGTAVRQRHQGPQLLLLYSSAILNVFLMFARWLLKFQALYLCSRKEEEGRVKSKSLIDLAPAWWSTVNTRSSSWQTCHLHTSLLPFPSFPKQNTDLSLMRNCLNLMCYFINALFTCSSSLIIIV